MDKQREAKFQSDFNKLKKELYNKGEAVLVINREPKKRTLNPNNVEKYKTDLVYSYNALTNCVYDQWQKNFARKDYKEF